MTEFDLPDELILLLRTTFTRPKPSALSELALDLRALALGLRTGCLLDKLALDPARAQKLGAGLRKLGPGWDDLVAVHEPESQQSLVVNTRLLRQRLVASAWPSFVEVATPQPAILHEPPSHLRPMLEAISAAGEAPGFHLLALPLADDDAHGLARAMIPLVGYLLEYPVVYTLEGGAKNSGNCLGGRELTLAQVWLHAGKDPSGTHLLLAFSVPTELLAPAGKLPFTSQRLHGLLLSMYSSRLEGARWPPGGLHVWDRVEVVVKGGVVQDRFAL